MLLHILLFMCAHITGTCLTDTYLNDTYLNDTSLTDTSLTDTSLTDTYLTDTSLTDTSLTDTYPADARRQKEHDDKPFKVKVVSPPPEELLPGTHFTCCTSTKNTNTDT